MVYFALSIGSYLKKHDVKTQPVKRWIHSCSSHGTLRLMDQMQSKLPQMFHPMPVSNLHTLRIQAHLTHINILINIKHCLKETTNTQNMRHTQ